MQAAIWTGYGGPDRLEYGEIDDPVAGPEDILVRVHATTVSAGDCEMRGLALRFPLSVIIRFFFGLMRPKRARVLGQEFAGVVEAVGANVTGFAAGDRVFGETGMMMGANAELLKCSRSGSEEDAVIARVPENVDLATAAAVPLGGREALKYLRAAEIKSGETMLVVGAGGSIGTMAIQLAVREGATVTAVDTQSKLETLTSIGAARVISCDAPYSINEKYDVIFDVVGKTPRRHLVGWLAPGGRLIRSNPRFLELLRGSRPLRDGHRVITGTASKTDDLAELAALLETGEITPVRDPRSFSLSEIADAHRYVESGEKLGSLVVQVTPKG
jgi:NADPH:quinone reductase-like Zn-dependent oxidoreductase